MYENRINGIVQTHSYVLRDIFANVNKSLDIFRLNKFMFKLKSFSIPKMLDSVFWIVQKMKKKKFLKAFFIANTADDGR